MRRQSNVTVWIIALAVVLVVVLVFCPSVAVESAYPFERAALFLRRGVWSRVTGAFAGSAAQAENVRLRRELAALAMLSSEAERLEAENARLRGELGFAAREPGRWLAASVLSRGGGAAVRANTLRIDRGSADGVREGAVAAVAEGLVGRVTAVTLHTAEVTLVTDPSVRPWCEIETGAAKPPRGALEGGSADCLVMGLLRNFEAGGVPPQSRVVTAGLGGVYPRGLAVGRYVEASGDGQRQVPRKAYVRPAVDFESLSEVFVRHAQ